MRRSAALEFFMYTEAPALDVLLHWQFDKRLLHQTNIELNFLLSSFIFCPTFCLLFDCNHHFRGLLLLLSSCATFYPVAP